MQDTEGQLGAQSNSLLHCGIRQPWDLAHTMLHMQASLILVLLWDLTPLGPRGHQEAGTAPRRAEA